MDINDTIQVIALTLIIIVSLYIVLITLLLSKLLSRHSVDIKTSLNEVLGITKDDGIKILERKQSLEEEEQKRDFENVL